MNDFEFRSDRSEREKGGSRRCWDEQKIILDDEHQCWKRGGCCDFLSLFTEAITLLDSSDTKSYRYCETYWERGLVS